MRRHPVIVLLAVVAAAIGVGSATRARAEQVLAGQTAGTTDYPARAIIDVNIPETLQLGGANNREFVFDSDADVRFYVSGHIRIWRSGALPSINDPFSGVFTPPVGLNAMQLEVVQLVDFKVTKVEILPGANALVQAEGASVNGLEIGDGTTGGTNNGPLFSTGGSVELAPDGSTAQGFLNLFLGISLDAPNIPASALTPFGFSASYEIGELFNSTVLHLDAIPDTTAFPPKEHFFQSAASRNFFAPTTNQFVIDLSTKPIPGSPLRPLAPMIFAKFVETELWIVPEPASMALAGCALAGLSWAAVRRRRSTPRR